MFIVPLHYLVINIYNLRQKHNNSQHVRYSQRQTVTKCHKTKHSSIVKLQTVPVICDEELKVAISTEQGRVTERISCTFNTHTQPFIGLLSRTTRVGLYLKKHSPTHTHPDDQTSFIIFLHLQWSMASSLFSLRAWQSSRTTSLQVLFGPHLGLWPSQHMPIPMQPVLPQYQCYVIYT